MKLRTRFAFAASVCVVILFIKGILILSALWASPATSRGQTSSPEDLQAVTVVFGIRDPVATVWDGSATITDGTIDKIVGYHFTPEAQILPNHSWKCSTHPWPAISFDLGAEDKMTPYPRWVQSIGITIHFRGQANTRLTIKTKQGEFSFRPADILEPEGIYPLGNRVEVHRTPVVTQLTNDDYQDDYPSLASDGGDLWLAWQGFRAEGRQTMGDTVFVQRYGREGWTQREALAHSSAGIFMTGVAAHQGSVIVVWSERQANDDWHLMARVNEGQGFGSPEVVTREGGSNLFHRVVSDPSGGFHVAYQSWRRARSSIYLKSRVNGEWTSEVELSDPDRGERENDWKPAVAADHDGVVWVAWDSYKGGSYNVFLRGVRNGKPGSILQVTDSKRFHANSTIAVDRQNRVWIAWDEAPENWGKDFGFRVGDGTPIYQSRTVKVAVYDQGRWLSPLSQPGDLPPQSSYYGMSRYFHTARLVADESGRMWLLTRPRSDSNWVRSIAAHGGKWEAFAQYYEGDRWSDVFMIPNSVSRHGAELQAAATSAGVYAVLVSDHRPWGGRNTGLRPEGNDLMFTKVLRPSRVEEARLTALPPEAPTKLPSEPDEAKQIGQIRDHEILLDGDSYRIFRGDLHRHTEISTDGASDGTVVETYRYAMDAADLDFLGVTDHQSGGDLYSWWRLEKYADMFHVPGFFTTIYATERSVSYPNGHRNLFFLNRRVPILPVGPDERQGKVNSGPVLYPFLRNYNGLAASHSSNTDMGTDWRDHDPDLEPLVEIYQGIRTSAEHEGAPLAMSQDRPELWVGGYRPKGFVWNAWAKGYKLGVQSSSDHLSTHRSYSCFLAKDSSRSSLFEAMRHRHSYAATSNILLDFRATVEGKSYLQGDAVAAHSRPVFLIEAVGSTDLTALHIIRDNEYIYSSTKLDSPRLRFEYTDQASLRGEHYYYVRIEQEDKNLAWSSPIWVVYRDDAR